jgi:hypothetical protein
MDPPAAKKAFKKTLKNQRAAGMEATSGIEPEYSVLQTDA